MNDANDNNGVVDDGIENEVGKALHERLSQVPMSDRARKRLGEHTVKGVAKPISEVQAKTRTSALIPRERLQRFDLGQRSNNEAPTHP